MKFGPLLRLARKAAGLSIPDMAALLCVSAGYISNVETGKSAPLPDEKIKRVAECFGISEAPLLSAAREDREVRALAKRLGDTLKARAQDIPHGVLTAIEALIKDVV